MLTVTFRSRDACCCVWRFCEKIAPTFSNESTFFSQKEIVLKRVNFISILGNVCLQINSCLIVFPSCSTLVICS